MHPRRLPNRRQLHRQSRLLRLSRWPNLELTFSGFFRPSNGVVRRILRRFGMIVSSLAAEVWGAGLVNIGCEVDVSFGGADVSFMG